MADCIDRRKVCAVYSNVVRAVDFKEGDLVVYRKEKCTGHPGRRASDVRPAPRGETYTYHVDKFWIVEDRHGDTLQLRTPRGKRYEVSATDPSLRKPTWIERLWLMTRGRGRLESLTREGRN